MDLGIGISGSPGRDRVPLASARDIAAILLDEVLSDRPPAPTSPILVMLSGLGGTPDAELYLLYGEIDRSEEHTSELQSLMRISYAVFCLKTKKYTLQHVLVPTFLIHVY